MGYSHYFSYDPLTPQWLERWPALCADAEQIAQAVESQGIALAGGLGSGRPQFSPDWIWLNGADKEDGSHETLMLESRPWHSWEQHPQEPWTRYLRECWEQEHYRRDSVKTARKPYDLAVTAILLRAHLLHPRSVVLHSDGSWEQDWRPARELVADLFGAGCDYDPLRLQRGPVPPSRIAVPA